MRMRTVLGLGAVGVLALGSMGFSAGDPQICLDLVLDLFGTSVGEPFCLPG